MLGPLPSSPPTFVTYGIGDNVCPDCRRRYESFGPKRKIIEGGCGHARCLECCTRRDITSPAGCPQCERPPSLSTDGLGKHNGGSGGSSAGSCGSIGGIGGGGGGHYVGGGGRESGFQSYAASVSSDSSSRNSSVDSFAGHRDYAGIRARVSSPRPPSVISLLSRY